MKINTQLLLSQSLLIILSIMIVVLNIVTFKNIESDAIFINYAGKLRYLNYEMLHMSHEIIMDTDEKSDRKEKLILTIGEYEGIIDKLIQGCPSLKLKKLEHRDTLRYILTFKQDWHEKYKAYYENILNNNDDQAYIRINSLIFDYVKQIDHMVSGYSSFSEEKVRQAILRNAFTILIIVILGSYSHIVVNNKIKIPMNKLLDELKDMDLIDNELAKKINLSQQNELATMSSYIDELIYDGLTKTYNRRTGLSKLARVLKKGRKDLHFSLIFIDLNGLKEVNDNLGHEEGDKLLILTVDSIQEIIRDDDFIIRLGGDEFLLALKDVNEKEAQLIWTRILEKYNQINSKRENPFIISVSHGIVEYNNYDNTDLEELIKIADGKMYIEKKKIKNHPEYKVIRDR